MNKQEFMAMSLPFDLKCKFITDRIQHYSAVKYEAEFDTKIEVIKSTPILRPLSDLNIEMQDGRTFMQYFECMFDFESDNTCPIRMYINSGWTTTINELPFEIVIKLVEWHFDICELIERGEAVDYHTLPDFVF